jgi:hypothetical protein
MQRPFHQTSYTWRRVWRVAQETVGVCVFFWKTSTECLFECSDSLFRGASMSEKVSGIAPAVRPITGRAARV